MKKAVIFDLDGLLIDSETIAYKIDSELVGKYGHEFPLAEYIAHYSGKRTMPGALLRFTDCRIRLMKR